MRAYTPRHACPLSGRAESPGPTVEGSSNPRLVLECRPHKKESPPPPLRPPEPLRPSVLHWKCRRHHELLSNVFAAFAPPPPPALPTPSASAASGHQHMVCTYAIYFSSCSSRWTLQFLLHAELCIALC